MANLQGGRVILGISSFRGEYMLPKILKKFNEKYPGVRVDIVEANSMALEDHLVRGSVDLAIVALPLTRVDHEVEFLKRDEIFLVANRHHPVMKHARKRDGSPYYRVDLKDTAEYEYILSDYDTILGSISRREFKKAGVRVISHNSNITAAMGVAMAREGLGLAFTYHSCAMDRENAVYLSIGGGGSIPGSGSGSSLLHLPVTGSPGSGQGDTGDGIAGFWHPLCPVRNNDFIVPVFWRMLHPGHYIFKINVQLIKGTICPASHPVLLNRKQLLSKLQHFLPSVIGFNIHDDQFALPIFGEKNRFRDFSAHISDLIIILTNSS